MRSGALSLELKDDEAHEEDAVRSRKRDMESPSLLYTITRGL